MRLGMLASYAHPSSHAYPFTTLRQGTPASVHDRGDAVASIRRMPERTIAFFEVVAHASGEQTRVPPMEWDKALSDLATASVQDRMVDKEVTLTTPRCSPCSPRRCGKVWSARWPRRVDRIICCCTGSRTTPSG